MRVLSRHVKFEDENEYHTPTALQRCAYKPFFFRLLSDSSEPMNGVVIYFFLVVDTSKHA